MSINRKLTRIHTPENGPGFLGAGHMARPVVNGHFRDTDPFIMMMDDVLDKKDNTPVGGPHPHAGFETVSLLLEGQIGDEAHKMNSGDFQIMTAGSGIVHTETIDTIARMRLLQLWLTLPSKHRWATPRVQDLRLSSVPATHTDGVQIKLYSGQLSGMVSPVQNYVPLIVADITIETGKSTTLQLPANFNTFLYVIRGEVKIGEEKKQLRENQVGWLNILPNDAQSNLELEAGGGDARFVVYAAKPTGENIVSHGPFIADSTEDINRLFQDYRQNRMRHISTVPYSQRLMY